MAEMFDDPSADPRDEPPTGGDERATLVGFLRWQRQTFELKCSGLDFLQMAAPSVEPILSLLGLLRHMADVERHWFRRVMSSHDAPPLFWSNADADGDFTGAVADPNVVDQAWTAWRAEVAFSEQYVTEAADLDVTGDEHRRGAMSLRWVLVHMIEEYARHNGHVDLLRERIDGLVGQ